jgi:hypothetical protein
MDCEQLLINLETAALAYENSVSYTATIQAELQQAQWAEMATMGQLMIAAMLYQEYCVNMRASSGLTADILTQMAKAFSSSETLRAKVSEFLALLKSKK